MARSILIKPLVLAGPLIKQSRKQFYLDYSLFLAGGAGLGLFNYFVFGFPIVGSGSKIFIGFAAVGLFSCLDLSLERERNCMRLALNQTPRITPPEEMYPMTHRFSLIAILLIITTTVIILMVVQMDIYWLSNQEAKAENIDILRNVVLAEILFVMGVILALMVNLILSYAANLRLLFDIQTRVLARVSGGGLDRFVPVMTNDEFGFIAGHTNNMIMGLRDRMRMRKSLEVAREVQLGLLPQKPPDIPGLDMAGAGIYCDETGGDYYDFIPASLNGGDALWVVVADVTGHGVGAALLMASVRAFLINQAGKALDPAQALSGINRLISKDTMGSGRFVTMFLLEIDISTKSLSWASAGHDPALLCRAQTGEILPLEVAGDLPLGVEADWSYTLKTAPAPGKGDVIVLCTDGVWETDGADGEMFGKKRLNQVVSESAGLDAAGIVGAITEKVTAYRGDRPQEDDITLAALKF